MSIFRALTSISKKLLQNLLSQPFILPSATTYTSNQLFLDKLAAWWYHDGRSRGSLWRGKKLIDKEALYVVLGLKQFRDNEEKLNKFIKNHVVRLLKAYMVIVLTELERQQGFSCF